jgi:hypothetical protein
MGAACFNIDDLNDAREYTLGTSFDSHDFGERLIVETFEELLRRYFYYPETKSLGPDGQQWQRKTQGRLLRTHVILGKRHRIGKEVDRRWKGDDLKAMHQTLIEYPRRARRLV